MVEEIIVLTMGKLNKLRENDVVGRRREMNVKRK